MDADLDTLATALYVRGCGFGGEGRVAEFVDDEQGGSGEEPHGGRPAAFDGCAVAAGSEVGGGGEVGPVAHGPGLAGESDSEVRLADTGRADEQTVRRGLEEAAGAELVDQRAVNTRLGIEVEVVPRR